MKFKYPNVFLSMLLCMALVLISHVPLYALPFTWGGVPISGEAGQENPNFFPEGSANFVIEDNTLTLTLTYTGSSESLSSVNQVLTGLTWDLVGFTGSLTAGSAVIPGGSSLILDPNASDPSAFDGTDLSGQWAYKDDITVLSAPNGPLGPYGVGAIGDINFGEDTFGTDDIINGALTQYTPAPNGIDFGLVPLGSLPSNGGFQNQGPVVQNAIVFDFSFDGTLSEDMFTNVTPLFGSEGAAPVPEPATMLLLGSGLVGLAGLRRKFRKE